MNVDLTVLLSDLVSQISLSNTAKDRVETEYSALSNLIVNNEDSEIEVHPQGSYSLGTAIRPLDSSDDYDIDAAIVFQHTLRSAEQVKKRIGSILRSSSRYADKLLPEKKRAWTITYNNSHVDIVPAKAAEVSDMYVTNKKDANYDFINSSPFKFRKWFSEQGREIFQASFDGEQLLDSTVEKPTRYERSTVLQSIVKILKHHRNVMYQNENPELKPISMIITILSAEAYDGESDLGEGLKNVVAKLRKCIEWDIFGNAHIYNPVDKNEDFADKWLEHPERKREFFKWLDNVEDVFGTVFNSDRMRRVAALEQIYGESAVKKAYEALGTYRGKAQKAGTISYGESGLFSSSGSPRTAKPNTFWGDI